MVWVLTNSGVQSKFLIQPHSHIFYSLFLLTQKKGNLETYNDHLFQFPYLSYLYFKIKYNYHKNYKNFNLLLKKFRFLNC